MKLEKETALPILKETGPECSCESARKPAADLGGFAALPEGHVIRTLAEEHARLLDLLDELEALAPAIERASGWPAIAEEMVAFRRIAEHLVRAESHHEREERVLFARLGERGVTGPSQAMTREHECIRDYKRRLLELAMSPGSDLGPFKRHLRTIVSPFAQFLREHIYKENSVLYPYALKVIQDERVWTTMKAECDAIGYCCQSRRR